MKRNLFLVALVALVSIMATSFVLAYNNNQAVSLDGSGDYITVPASSSLVFPSGITVEAWVRMDALGRSQVVLHKKNGSSNDLWLGLDSSNRLVWDFRVDNKEYNFRITPPTPFTTGMWYHVAWTYDVTTGIGRAYINGDRVAEYWLFGPLAFHPSDGWYIGADTDGSSINDYWQGEIDEVRLWNVARTDAKIRAFRGVVLSGNEPGLVAYWKLDEAAGTTTASDTTANNNDGTLQGNADFIAATGTPLNLPVNVPKIDVFPTTLNFCDTRVGEFTRLSFEIANVGQPDLQVTLASDNARFSVLPASATIPGSTSRGFDVTFNPTAPGAQTGTLTIASNDPANPSVTVSLSGSGAADLNRAASFDGNGDYIQVLKDIPETNLTIEFWFQTTAAYTGLLAVQQGSLGSQGNDRHIYLANGYLKQRVWNNEVLTSASSGFNDGQWHHVAMVIQQGVGQFMYVDGQLEAKGSKDRSDLTTQDRFVLGYSNDRGWFNGLIDEVRIWNIPRSHAAITVFKDLRLTGNEPGLIGYWRLDDCPGSRFAEPVNALAEKGYLFADTTFVDANRTQTASPAQASLAVLPTSLDFGEVKVGESAELILEIVNQGQTNLVVSDISSNDPQLFISPEPFTSAGNQPATSSLILPYTRTQRVRVRYTPTSAAALNATITITSNDANSPTTLTVTGKGITSYAHALAVDGNGDYASVPYNVAFRPNQWTMEAWVKFNALDTSRRGIMGSGWNYRDFYLGLHNKKFFTWVYQSSGNSSGVHSRFEPVVDTWYHVAATYDGHKLRLYVNGILQGEVAAQWSTDSNTPFYLGRTHGGEYINGLIEEARFWNIARSRAEIQATLDRLLPAQATGLVGYWRFDESLTSRKATDFTGNGFHASLGGDAKFVKSDAPLKEAPTAPTLVLTPWLFNFGQVTVGHTVELPLILFNAGKQKLDISSLSTNNAAYTVVPSVLQLKWGERYEGMVRFAPQAPSSVPGRLTITSNDAASPHKRTLLGVGKSFINRAVSLDGSGDMVSILHDAMFDMKAVTVEAWVKPMADLTGKSVSFIRKQKSNNDTPFVLEQLYNQENSGTDELFMWVNNGQSWYKNNIAAYNTFAFAPGKWYHLAATYDGSEIRLYVNGRLLASQRYTGGIRNNSDPIYIGGRGNDRWFQGLIDEVRIYNYARSQAEIQATKDRLLTGKEPGLVGYWPFDDSPQSQKVSDASGHGHWGSLIGDARLVRSDVPVQLASTGPDIAIIPDSIEFGKVQQGSTVQRMLTILNRGQGTLQVTKIESSDAQVIPQITAFPLLPGEKMEVPLLFTPTSPGTFAETLTISSNDPNASTVGIGMSGVVTSTVPTFNAALQLDGNSDYVRVPDADSLDLQDNFTFEAWVFVTSSGYRTIFEKQGSYVWSVISGKVHWALMTAGNWEWHNTNVVVPYNEWTHLALVYTSPNVKIYKNGTLASTIADPQGGDLTTTNDILRIGGRSNGEWFSGKLDEVRIWDVVRTQAQIRQNMFDVLLGTEAGLVGYWPFNGDAQDTSSAGNNGMLINDAKIVRADLPLPPDKGDANQNGQITAYDGVRILQTSLGLTDPTIIEFYASDVTKNWRVTAYDASLVLQLVAGVISAFPAPSLRPLGILPETTLAGLGKIDFSDPNRLVVPVEVNDLAGVYSAQVRLGYDPARLEFVQIRTTESSSQYQLAYDSQDGEIRAALATASPRSGEGTLLVAEFRVRQAPLKNRHDAVQLLEVMLNEGFSTRLESRTPPPERTALLPNYPNPFNPETWIPYLLAQDAPVTCRIYDMRGLLVREIHLGHQKAGNYTTRDRAIYWDGRNDLGESVASGVYFYTLQAGDFTATRRMTILR